jgi:cytidine deaminase
MPAKLSLGPRVDWNVLSDAATAARAQSYSPYSNFAVGAALRTEDGRIFTGVNVENASYGLTMCAERTAIVTAVTAGARRFLGMVVAGPELITPCGACRQVMNEFGPSFLVRCYGPDGTFLEREVRELLPHGFDSEALR